MDIIKYINENTTITFTGKFRQACISAFALCCISDERTTSEELNKVKYLLDNVHLHELNINTIFNQFMGTLTHLQKHPKHVKKHFNHIQKFKYKPSAGNIIGLCVSLCDTHGINPLEKKNF
jgi:hypothetical protein